MSFVLSERSLGRLEGVDPRLAAVVKRAIEISEVDFMVVEGLRSRQQCMVNYGKGRTAGQLAAFRIPPAFAQPKVAKVTWLNNPFASKHCDGKAVDLLPAPYDWKLPGGFKAMATAMKKAAAEKGVPMTWGGNWNGAKDMPHFEI